MNGSIQGTDADSVRPAYLPLEYYLDFLRLLREYEDLISVVTYAGLPWGDDYAHEQGYPEERRRWEKSRSPERVTVLIQHDVDSIPQRSWLAARHEESIGVPSSFMIFHRRIDRRWFESEGELVFTDYLVDDELLRRLHGKGWCLGYHSNALDQALFDDELARGIFARDVADLRQRFEIGYFSAHGGLRSPEGRTNNQLHPPDLKSLGLRWVHNGATPVFDGHWSDGGLNGNRLDPESRDLRLFLLGFEKGKRYRILTHPQYYDTGFDGTTARIGGTAWFREIDGFYREGKGGRVWEKVRRHFDALGRKSPFINLVMKRRSLAGRINRRFRKWTQKK